MTAIPIIPPIEKNAGEDIPFPYDWAPRLEQIGDTSGIAQSFWTVDQGAATVGTGGRAPTIAGTVTNAFIAGGSPGEKCIINNSIQTVAGNKLVKLFELKISKGSFEGG